MRLLELIEDRRQPIELKVLADNGRWTIHLVASYD